MFGLFIKALVIAATIDLAASRSFFFFCGHVGLALLSPPRSSPCSRLPCGSSRLRLWPICLCLRGAIAARGCGSGKFVPLASDRVIEGLNRMLERLDRRSHLFELPASRSASCSSSATRYFILASAESVWTSIAATWPRNVIVCSRVLAFVVMASTRLASFAIADQPSGSGCLAATGESLGKLIPPAGTLSAEGG